MKCIDSGDRASLTFSRLVYGLICKLTVGSLICICNMDFYLKLYIHMSAVGFIILVSNCVPLLCVCFLKILLCILLSFPLPVLLSQVMFMLILKVWCQLKWRLTAGREIKHDSLVKVKIVDVILLIIEKNTFEE